MYRVVVVSGLLLYSDSLKSSINKLRAKVKVVRSFGTIEPACEIGGLKPDLLTIALDQLIPNLCLRTLRDVKRVSPGTRVVLLYGENYASYVRWLVQATADASEWSLIHVDHVGGVGELCRALLRIARGETVRIPELNLAAAEERSAGPLMARSDLTSLGAVAARMPARGGSRRLGWTLATQTPG